MKRIVFFALLGVSLPISSGARSSDVCFSPQEVRTMFEKRDLVSRAAAKCLKNYWETHQKFFQENGYSKYFGNRNKALNTEDKRAGAILMVLWPELLSRQELKLFEDGFLKANPPDSEGNRKRPGLSDIENFLKIANPRRYSEYLSKKPSLKIEERAKEERGNLKGQVDLRGNLENTLQNISCVDMTRRCLHEGFLAAGLGDTFAKIDKEVLNHDVSGTEMQKALADLGWRTLFFNPDTSQNASWDAEDRQINPLPPPCDHPDTPANPCPKKKVWMGSWGGHADAWALYCDANGRLRPGKKTGGVMCSDEYQLGGERPIPVDDKRLLVDFQTSVPSAFKAVPFFVGTAHGGYHVFPGFYGDIIEAHSMRALSSISNLEVSHFNPIDQENQGGPRWTNSEHYRSGVIVVPPGYLDRGSSLLNPPVDDNGCVDLRPKRR